MLSLLGRAMGTGLACYFKKCGCCSGALHLIPGACNEALCPSAPCVLEASGDGASSSGKELGSAPFSCTAGHDSAFVGRSCSIH